MFCVRNTSTKTLNTLKGGIAISKEINAIIWLVVSEQCRSQGVGSTLLQAAISHLNSEEDIVVQTFDKTVQEGVAARKLYLNSGFEDLKRNPKLLPHSQQDKHSSVMSVKLLYTYLHK